MSGLETMRADMIAALQLGEIAGRGAEPNEEDNSFANELAGEAPPGLARVDPLPQDSQGGSGGGKTFLYGGDGVTQFVMPTDEELDVMRAEFHSLYSKTSALNKEFKEKAELKVVQEECRPYNLLKDKKSEVEAMSDVNAAKAKKALMLNLAMKLFEHSRFDADERDFLAELFGNSKQYYSLKNRKEKNEERIWILKYLHQEHVQANAAQAEQKKLAEMEAEADASVTGKRARVA